MKTRLWIILFLTLIWCGFSNDFHIKNIFLGSLILVLAFFNSCKNEQKKEQDTFSSPKTLFVEHVSAFTSGYISKASEITVKLTKPVETAEPGKGNRTCSPEASSPSSRPGRMTASTKRP